MVTVDQEVARTRSGYGAEWWYSLKSRVSVTGSKTKRQATLAQTRYHVTRDCQSKYSARLPYERTQNTYPTRLYLEYIPQDDGRSHPLSNTSIEAASCFCLDRDSEIARSWLEHDNAKQLLFSVNLRL